MTTELTVITDHDGDVVGTQLGHGEPDEATGATASLIAGPGQTLHRLEWDMPKLKSNADVDMLHRQLAEFLRKGSRRNF